jgi:hypothetical protein
VAGGVEGCGVSGSVGERAAGRAASLLERRTSRRGLLARAALAGSAFAVAPLRYLLRPASAWAVIAPQNCRAGSRCNDGFTEFCCSITGGENACPEGSYIAGWWKCTHYAGSHLCGEEGVRYYVDCNRRPGDRSPSCHCAHGDCGQRRVACNHFRYGQCNTDIGGVTPIVCRIVTCVNPATIPDFGCNPTYMQDNRTCDHEADCLSAENARVLGLNPGA